MSEHTEPPLEREQIEQVMREVHIRLTRGHRSEAISQLRMAVDAHPREAAFWEAYGDLLVEANQLEEAREAFYQAKEIRKPRLTAEKKYADVVYRIASAELPIMSDEPPTNPTGAAVLSLFVPGAGQFYNRQFQKAIVFVSIWLVCFIPAVIIWRDSRPIQKDAALAQRANQAISGFTSGPGIWLVVLMLCISLAAVIDAYSTSKRMQDEMGGPVFPKGKRPQMPDMSFFDDVNPPKKPNA